MIGTILNFKQFDNIYSKAIRIYNKIVYHEEGYTHTGIITDETKEDIEIAEAIGKGFTISWYNKIG